MARERLRADRLSNTAANTESGPASASSSGARGGSEAGESSSPRLAPEKAGLPGILGQAAVTHALCDAIAHNRVHHAYLFDGPEGTGKASCARALFAALNCLDPPTLGGACGQCESCHKLAAGSHPDLIPFDMSLSGLADEVDRLIKRLQFPPFEGRAQMVILDPADLLAMPTAVTAANRLLKTLEEPRANTHLVLVTTAASSLLPTLRSRCQRLRFLPLADDLLRTLLLRDPATNGDGDAPDVDALDPNEGTSATGRFSEADLQAAIALAQGSIGAARRALADRERLQRNAETAQALLSAARAGRATQIVDAASSVGSDREQAQEILEHLWLQLHRELQTAVQQRRLVASHEGLIAALRATRSAQQAIRGYTAAPLAIERMLRHIGDALPDARRAPAGATSGRSRHVR